MFHRVKSEGQDPQSPKSENEEVNNVAAKAPAPTAPKAPHVKLQTTQEYTTPAKDTKNMDNSSQEEDKQADAKTSAAPASFSYQRAPAAPTSAPAAYPGSTGYAGSYASGSAAETRSVSSSSDRRLTIGSGITMSGEIESCDYLLVEGTVEAALKGANVLDIADSGTFYGTVEIDEATIAGRFEGDITVHGRLTISSTGTVTGTIAYKELEIEAGAVIDGKLTPLSAASAAKKEAPSKAKETSAPAAPAKAKKTEVKETEAANNDGGLFSKAAAAE